MSDYRVTVKVRNGRLLRAINNAGYQSIPKFCEAAGVGYPQVNDLINMTASPLDRGNKVRPIVESLMDFLCEPDQRCGTCKWWEKRRDNGMGACELPMAALPECVRDVERDYVHESLRTTCPCWEAKLPAPPEIEQ